MKRFRCLAFSMVIAVFTATICYAYENNIYIWQRSWDENIRSAVRDIEPCSSHFIILCGDLKYADNKPAFTPVNIRWEYFKPGKSTVTLAFRINTYASQLFTNDSALNQVVIDIKEIIDSAISAAQKEGTKIKGIQFDYDCPTSKLDRYEAFLKVCNEKFPSIPISITALPAWLDSGNFINLVKQTSYYVLQLHSFEKPKNINEANNIFPRDKAGAYLDKASGLNHPYYISLPTYGYEVVFTKEGKFVGLRAENMPTLWGKDIDHGVAMTDPNELIKFIGKIKTNKPKDLLGVCWFRLPLKTDEFNWDIKTLIAVINEKAPSLLFKAEIESSKDGLYNLYIINAGEQNTFRMISFDLSWPKEASLIYDILGKYQIQSAKESNSLHIEGLPPKVGGKSLVAWFRATDKDKNVAFKVGEVRVNEKY